MMRGIVVSCVLLAACMEAAAPSAPVTPPQTTTPAAPAAPVQVASVRFTPERVTLVGNEAVHVTVTVFGSNGAELTDPQLEWIGSDWSIARFQPTGARSANLQGVLPGLTRIAARVNGISATLPIEVKPGAAGCTGTLVIESFSMLEVQYSTSTRWFYAPQVRVRESTGRGTADVIQSDFTIPGLGAAPPYYRLRRVKAGESRDLFQEVYGDFELTIDGAGRATAGLAELRLTVHDAAGYHTLTATGPVVPGIFPTTYSGVTITNDPPCP